MDETQGYTQTAISGDFEQEIARRGLIERYQDALIEVLGLDMQVFNSAIELGPHAVPAIPNNTFFWEGHAYLWLFSQATPQQKAQAFLKAMEGHNDR